MLICRSCETNDYELSTEGLRFGSMNLSWITRESFARKGRKIKLQEQPLQILCVLMDRSGVIVTRQELREKIWPSDTSRGAPARLLGGRAPVAP